MHNSHFVMDDLSRKTLLESVLTSFADFSKELNIPSSLLCVSTESIEMQKFKHEDSKVQSAVETFISALQRHLNDLQAHNVGHKELHIDESLVQITVSKAQLDKRIASFITHAQNAVDEQNIQEFCASDEQGRREEEGCARTRARYKRRAANRTHMEVSRIENVEGPQMHVNSQGKWCVPPDSKTPRTCPPAVQERLSNLEHHVGINASSIPKDVYGRLKTIEDRVLYLESISPEYFTGSRDDAPKRQKLSGGDAKIMSIDEIDDRIRLLRRNLLSGKVR